VKLVWHSTVIGLLPFNVIAGGSASSTVTVKLQLGPVLALQVTVVVPTGKNDPEGGVHVIVPQEPGLVGEKVTTAPHAF
jgi:hypothetical protein